MNGEAGRKAAAVWQALSSAPRTRRGQDCTCSSLSLWDELLPPEQARIVARLVERVDIGMDGLNVRLRVNGLSGLAGEMLAGDMGAAA